MKIMHETNLSPGFDTIHSTEIDELICFNPASLVDEICVWQVLGKKLFNFMN